ncbi:MAG TPA: diphthamide synthesis protein [Candidatus Nanoarchaeia archaeon]|nr:diphthamide synthesis protein [Candidatus Nanoarchaeia archaeon]
MEKTTIQDIEKTYDLELDKLVKEIKKQKAKLILLQFPDGLKMYATIIVDYLESKLAKQKVEFLIWLESCYGACDIPFGLEGINPKIDLIVQFGHSSMMPNY